MKVSKIVTKLWVVLTVLSILVIGAIGVAEGRFMEHVYYQQQVSHLVSVANMVGELVNSEKDSKTLEDKIALIAGFYNANIMLLDDKGVVKICQGMGVSAKDLVMDANNPHYHPLDDQDLQRLFQGKIVAHRGNSPFFHTDVLAVAVPLWQNGQIANAVILYAPLEPLVDQLTQLQQLGLYTALGGILLAIVLSLIVSRLISQPLLKMNRVALEMASGNYQSRVDIKRNDEVGLLANSLNILSGRLQEKINQLNEQEQIRREFVTNVAHEIKTPLTIMQGFTEMLLDGLFKNETERTSYLNNILDEILRLKRLANEVLDLKRMEEGNFTFEKRPCSITDIINKVALNFNKLLQQKNISFHIAIPEKLPPVICDFERMERVFINLIDNAIRHTALNGRISIRAAAVQSNELIVEVSDNGSGIPPEDLPFIFQRFYKADKSRCRSEGEGGTGLGLAIVKKIIKSHGGQITVQSKLNEGTTFIISLPLCRAE